MMAFNLKLSAICLLPFNFAGQGTFGDPESHSRFAAHRGTDSAESQTIFNVICNHSVTALRPNSGASEYRLRSFSRAPPRFVLLRRIRPGTNGRRWVFVPRTMTWVREGLDNR
jgi:hypothetical protein